MKLCNRRAKLFAVRLRRLEPGPARPEQDIQTRTGNRCSRTCMFELDLAQSKSVSKPMARFSGRSSAQTSQPRLLNQVLPAGLSSVFVRPVGYAIALATEQHSTLKAAIEKWVVCRACPFHRIQEPDDVPNTMLGFTDQWP